MIGLGWRKKEQGDALVIRLRESDKREEIVPIPAGQGQDTGHDGAPRWSFTAWATIPSITACPAPGRRQRWKFITTRADRRRIFECFPTDTTNTPA